MTDVSDASAPKIRRALLSVSDKTGLAELAAELHKHGVELLSTGGTAKAIRNAGIPVKDVSEFTGSPEIMDGRVKTLHPRVHGGILMRELPGLLDSEQLAQIGGAPIDLVVVNLYPFASTVAKGAPYEDAWRTSTSAAPPWSAPPPRTTRASPSSCCPRTMRRSSPRCRQGRARPTASSSR